MCPCPDRKLIYVRELFEELGVLRDGVWNERFLCFSPQERLFLYGKWQEGIEPAIGLSRKDREQFQRLENLFARLARAADSASPWSLASTAARGIWTGCRSRTGCGNTASIRRWCCGT